MRLELPPGTPDGRAWFQVLPASMPLCGDGIQSADLGEQCDDGNTVGGDGCSADCKTIESGFQCPTPGKPCLNMSKRGDGIVTGTETCDDANTDPTDGCDHCKIQPAMPARSRARSASPSVATASCS